MSMLVFLLEEASFKEMLTGVLPKLLPGDVNYKCISFEGKSDLEGQLERKIRNWQGNVKFMVVRDRDGGNCQEQKKRILEKCARAGRPDTLVRIVCNELESWYLGDLTAVENALQISGLTSQQRKRKYRNPDLLTNAQDELKKITKKKYQKIKGSRAIGHCMDIEHNMSHSFHVFIEGIKKILQ